MKIPWNAVKDVWTTIPGVLAIAAATTDYLLSNAATVQQIITDVGILSAGIGHIFSNSKGA